MSLPVLGFVAGGFTVRLHADGVVKYYQPRRRAASHVYLVAGGRG